MTARFSLIVAALAGLTGVMLGAFGSHALQGYLPTGLARAWQTAVDYQFVHGLALLAVGLMQLRHPASKSLHIAAAAFALGILLFSGSLYALALTQLGKLGMITPFGGVSFMIGWAALLLAALRSGSSPSG